MRLIMLQTQPYVTTEHIILHRMNTPKIYFAIISNKISD